MSIRSTVEERCAYREWSVQRFSDGTCHRAGVSVSNLTVFTHPASRIQRTDSRRPAID